jgi:hypothetical protein
MGQIDPPAATVDQPARSYRLRMAPKDIGVAIVVIVALTLGWLLRYQVEHATVTFRDADSPFRISYPRDWTSPPLSSSTALLDVENPRADSTFKTTLSVESRGLDPAAPPTLQTLVDRRVAQQGDLTAYRLLSTTDTTVDGAKGMRVDFAYVVQPIDAPRRQSLPVVVQAREYVVITQDRVYYIQLSAPENDYDRELSRFDRIIDGVRLQ